MTTNRRGQNIADLSAEHPYAFDTRTTKHQHLPDGTIVRLDTLEQYNGKTKLKTMTRIEIRQAATAGLVEVV